MRYGMKRAIVCFMHAVTWPLWVPSALAYRLRGTENIFDFSAKLISLVPGKVGQFLRASFYMQTLRRSHYDLAVAFGSFFAHPTAEVGRSVFIGSFSIIGNARIGNNVLIASRVSILSGKYTHGGGMRGEITKDTWYEAVTIGEGCWIGEGAIVMASLGRNCIAGAGSVVTKPVPDGIIAVGNPARFLRSTEENHDVT